ncbi:hypothetical protein MD484_g8066, partial [Candolleomyces efflorescens]
MSDEAKKVGVRVIPGWVEILLRGNANATGDHSQNSANQRGTILDEIFISDLQNSCVSLFDGSVDRVGTFVSIPGNDQEETLSIDWLCEMGVPVWYEWGDREEEIASKNPFWRRYAPPMDAVRLGDPCDPHCGPSYSADIFSRADLAVSLHEDLSPPNAPMCEMIVSSTSAYPRRPEPTPEERTWDAHFEKRAHRRAIVLSQETSEARVSRENRERCPPTNPKKTRFFIWEKNLSGKGFVRRRAEKDDMDDIFTEDGRFGRKQAKYDSVYNEWDLCDYFGPPDEHQLEYMAETWAEYEGTTFEKELTKCRAYYGLEGPFEEDGQSGESREQFEAIDTAEDNSAIEPCVLTPSQREIPHLVYELFGYALSLPGSSHAPPAPGSTPSSPPSLGLVPKVLGVSKLVPRNDAFWKSAEGQSVLAFIKSLSNGSSPMIHSWDLTLTSPMPIVTLPRFKLLRRSMVSVPMYLEEWDNNQGRLSKLVEAPQEAFWFASDHGQQWFIGCLSPAVALMICRLNQSLVHPMVLAQDLLNRGDYQYSKNDYESYLRTKRELLTGPAGRAALLRGGIAWRLAIEDTSFDEVFSGASREAYEGRGVLRGTGSGTYLIDNDLSADELDCLCGFYETFIGLRQPAYHSPNGSGILVAAC